MEQHSATRILNRALVVAVFLIVAAVCGLTACGSGSSTAASSSAASNSTASQASNSAYGDPVTIQNGDRTLTFTDYPTAFCCNTYAQENMAILGLAQYMVGRNVPSNSADVPLPEYQEALADIPQFEKSHENVTSTGATLVIGQVSAFKDNAWGTYEQFENEGVNTYTTEGTIVEDETIDNVYDDIEALGKIYKVEDRATEVIDGMKDRVQKVQDTVSAVPDDQKKKVFVMDSYKDNQIYTTSKGLQSDLIEKAGGINVTRNMADARWFNTSVETIVETNPDIIIFNDYGKQSIQEKEDFINSNPALADVTAVKEQNYVVIPLVSVMQDIRAASACETFAQSFYPDLFNN